MPKGVEFVRTNSDKPLKKKPKDMKESEDDTKDDSSDDSLLTSDEEQDNDAKNWEDSFKVVFRLTSAEIASKFWEMYKSNELAVKLADVLVERTLLTSCLLETDGIVSVRLHIDENDYQKILDFFKGEYMNCLGKKTLRLQFFLCYVTSVIHLYNIHTQI